MTTILGVDPGLNATGYGVITEEGGRLTMRAAGTLCPPGDAPLAERLLALHEGLLRIIDQHHPDMAVLEKIFTHSEHVTTAAMMAHARGVACVANAQRGVPVIEYLPTRIKKALSGNGHASKTQVARAVAMWLGIEPQSWASDVTDALGLAIAHAHIARSPAFAGSAR